MSDSVANSHSVDESLSSSEPFFCSPAARQAGESLAGSAPTGVQTWVLLEYNGGWPASVLPDSGLDEDIKEALDGALARHGAARFQFIKQEGALPRPPTLFIVQSGLDRPRIDQLVLADYQELTQLDLDALLTGSSKETENYAKPLVLVCTHGRRDLCCAKWGLPLYRTLASLAPEQVWQTTHLGGHRFAPTLVTLPQGIVYGWLEPEDASPLLDAVNSGQFYDLTKVRGRALLEPWEQAAEIELRRELGVLSINSLEQVFSTLLEDECRPVEMMIDGVPHTKEVREVDSGSVRYLSCGPKKSRPLTHFHVAARPHHR